MKITCKVIKLHFIFSLIGRFSQVCYIIVFSVQPLINAWVIKKKQDQDILSQIILQNKIFLNCNDMVFRMRVILKNETMMIHTQINYF